MTMEIHFILLAGICDDPAELNLAEAAACPLPADSSSDSFSSQANHTIYPTSTPDLPTAEPLILPDSISGE